MGQTKTKGGGTRPGSGPKSLYRPKTRNHSMQFTLVGLGMLERQAATYRLGRADYLEALLREYADDLEIGERTGRAVWTGKDPRPRGFRFTEDAHAALRRAATRLDVSEGDVVESLVRLKPRLFKRKAS